MSKSVKLSLDGSAKDRLLKILLVQRSSISRKKAFEMSMCRSKKEFDNIIDQLLKEGKVVITKKNKIVSPKMLGLMSAKVSAISNKFSFVSPLESNLPDIYVPIEHLKNAQVDDIVLLSHVRQNKKGFSARVDRVIFKGNRFVKGIFEVTNEGPMFVADRLYQDKIPVDTGCEVMANPGDKVQAYVIKQKRKLLAVITKVYGNSESAKVCSDAIIDSYGIPTRFSVEVIDEAKKLASQKISKEDIKERLDLRSEIIFTIDGEDAKDLDDAISVKKVSGGYELGVHIADVSYYVQQNSLIDQSARDRGTSIYFADRVIPMLPEQLSNGVCSLNQGEEKLTISAIMKISPKGKLLNLTLKKSVIVSRVRGVYSEINQLLEGSASDSIKDKYADVLGSILVAKELFEILYDSAEKRGNLSFENSDSVFKLDSNGVCVDINQRSRALSEMIIEQFMIKANESVALFAKNRGVPFVYRVHHSPDAERTRQLLDFARNLGFKCPKISGAITTDIFKNLVSQAESTPLNNLISNCILRSMSKAVYSDSPDGHFGLALEDYCHFTSPIRRYPDLVVHMILSDVLLKQKKKKLNNKFSELVINASDESTQLEIRALNAERDAEKCYMAEYARQHIGEVFDGTISGTTSRGFFVVLENSLEGFINLKTLSNGNFIYDGTVCHTNINTKERFCVGDSIKIKIISACVSTGLIDFQMET